MVKRKRNALLALFLCIPLSFLGCEAPLSDDLPNSDSESTVETETLFPTPTETEAAESKFEWIISGENCVFGTLYGDLSWYVGIAVRVERLLGKSPYSESDLKGKLMFDVEVLDIMEHGSKQASGHEVFFLPQEAKDFIAEGDEVLLFVHDTGAVQINGKKVWYMDAEHFLNKPAPIFRFEDGRMVIEERHLIKLGNGEYNMTFLRTVQRVHEDFRRCGIDGKYFFRNGMTLEELDRFYDLAAVTSDF